MWRNKQVRTKSSINLSKIKSFWQSICWSGFKKWKCIKSSQVNFVENAEVCAAAYSSLNGLPCTNACRVHGGLWEHLLTLFWASFSVISVVKRNMYQWHAITHLCCPCLMKSAASCKQNWCFFFLTRKLGQHRSPQFVIHADIFRAHFMPHKTLKFRCLDFKKVNEVQCLYCVYYSIF